MIKAQENSETTDNTSEEIETPSFSQMPLSDEVHQALEDMGFKEPTPVQVSVYKPAVEGKDLVVQARTGTGKTAAFGLPIVDRLVDPRKKAAQYLVLCPTRELALQIDRELSKLATHNGVKTVAVYGGAPIGPQIKALESGAQIIVGTPGRVLDHLERRTLDPSTIKGLILDESDEMLSMGFLPQITRVMDVLPKKHQVLLFSATLPPDVRRIAETKCTDPEFITLSGDHVGALSIEHFIYRTQGQKAEDLVRVIELENPESAIVFCNTRDQTKRLANALKKKGYAADWLNADLSQAEREIVMAKTRAEQLRFLVCTDVAAHGIDISHLTHVINADFPGSTENYVHRTGRTGRAGKTGTAISLITHGDTGNLYMLRLIYKIFPVEKELPSLRELESNREAAALAGLLVEVSKGAQKSKYQALAARVLASDEPEVFLAGLLAHYFESGAAVSSEQVISKTERVTEAQAQPKKKKLEAQKPTAEKPAKKEKKKPRQAEVAEVKEIREQRQPKPIREKAADSKLEVVSASALLAEEGLSYESVMDGDSAVTPSPKVTPREREKPRATQEVAPKPRGLKGKREAADARLYVDIGKDDQVTKNDLIDCLVDGGLKSAQVLGVLIRQRHSFVFVKPADVDQALDILDGGDVAGYDVVAELSTSKG